MASTNTHRYPRKTREQWQALIEHYENSTVTADEFCQQHNISSASLAKWRSVLNGQRGEPKADFVELKPSSSADSSTDETWAVQLSIGQHIVLCIR